MLCDTCENRGDCKSREAYARLNKFTNGTLGMCSGYKYDMKEPPPVGVGIIYRGSRGCGKSQMIKDFLEENYNVNVVVVRKKDIKKSKCVNMPNIHKHY